MGTAIGGYFIVREIQLNSDKRLIQNCEEKVYCPGRIEALERLVKAQRSLKSYNLESAILIESKNLTYSQIKSACYWAKAIYKGHYDDKNYKWIVDEKANQQYIQKLKQDQASEPQEPVDCSIWE